MRFLWAWCPCICAVIRIAPFCLVSMGPPYPLWHRRPVSWAVRSHSPTMLHQPVCIELWKQWKYNGKRSVCCSKLLTHWGRVTHICVRNLTIICSDNGLSPGWCQAIIWTNVGILLIGILQTNCNEILIKIHTFSSKKIYFKMSYGKWRPFCLGLNVLNGWLNEGHR